MDTRTAVIAQLRENTGAHMLDSGGAYGRGFERWAKVTDDTALSAPPVTVHPDYLTINEFALRCPCGMRMDVTRDEWQ